MSEEFKSTTVETMEADQARLLETAAKVGIDTWVQRVKNQTPHCGFGEKGGQQTARNISGLHQCGHSL